MRIISKIPPRRSPGAEPSPPGTNVRLDLELAEPRGHGSGAYSPHSRPSATTCQRTINAGRRAGYPRVHRGCSVAAR